MRYKFKALSYAIAFAMDVMRRKPLPFDAITPRGPTIADMIDDGTLPAPPHAEAQIASITKTKRVRPPKSKPLTEADIVEGGIYVPKRGNNKTPNYVVAEVDRTEAEQFGPLVIFQRSGDDDISSRNMADFLALVARRVQA